MNEWEGKKRHHYHKILDRNALMEDNFENISKGINVAIKRLLGESLGGRKL